MSELTDEQLVNWRAVLAQMFGSYAFIMPREQVQLFRDRMQADVERLPTQRAADEFCTCDQKKHGYTRHINDTVTCNKCGKTRR